MRQIYYYASLSFAALTLLFGLSAITGWLFELEYLLQYKTNTEHIVFNTALCFIAMAVAIFALHLQYTKTVAILCVSVSLLSILVLLQFFLTLPFNPDTLFFQHQFLTDHPTPGRMAPNTCVGFLLSSTILLLLIKKNKTLLSPTIVSLLSASLFWKQQRMVYSPAGLMAASPTIT